MTRRAIPLLTACLALAPRASFAQSSSSRPPSAAPSATQPPRLTRFVEAVYPAEALRRGESATVRLQIDIDDGGHVTGVSVVESSGVSAFDEAAVVAAREFEFEPARRNNTAVAARIRYRYRFTPPVRRPTDEDAPRPTATEQTASSSAPGPSASPSGAPTSSSSSSPAPTTEPTEAGITVYGRAPSREIGRREVTAEEIRRIPGARGDALLALQNLPGVGRPQFGIGQFIVRSSAPEDSLVTLEGNPIVLPFHFGGFASTISTDLIERIEFLPGNFSARYGRVAGGVINVTLRAPARDRIHAVADVDLIDAGVFASAPLGRNASVGIGARRSFIDLIGPLAFSGSDGTSFRQWPFYWDAQAMLDWDIGPNDSIRIVAAANDDQLILNFRDPNANDPNLRGNLGTHLSYYGLQTRWRHRFGDAVTHTFAPAISYNLTQGQVGDGVSFTFQSYNINFRDELEAHLSSRARVFIGIDSLGGHLDNDVHAPPLPANGIMDPVDPTTIVSYRAQGPFFNPAAYAETEIDATRDLRVLAGVRVDSYSLLNAVTVNPRMSARYAVHPRVVLRTGWGLYGTPPRGYFIVPGFGNPTLQPERWLHGTLGANVEIIPGVLDLDVAGFVKLGDNVVAPSTRLRVDASGQTVPERFANTGLGRVFGGEFMLRMRPGRLAPVYGLVSYTIQRAERTTCIGGSCPWYTYQYDQPHILTVVLGAILPFGFEAGVRVRYTSGSVAPNITGALFDAEHDVALTLTDPLHTGRLPAYFTLDVRVAKRFSLGPVRCQGILEILNTTNNANVESLVLSYDRRSQAYVTGLPIIPTIGIRAEY